MSDPTQQFPPPPAGGTAPGADAKDRSTPWKIAAVLLAVAAIGLGIWALVLNNDLTSTQDTAAGEIAALEAQNKELTDQVADLEGDVEAAETETAVVTKAAQQALKQTLGALGVAADGLVVQDQAITEATTALDEANETLVSATGDLEVAQAERDQALALAQNGQLCSAGSLTALTLVAEGDVDGATAALDEVAPACAATLG
jgi:cell division protein FtsB